MGSEIISSERGDRELNGVPGLWSHHTVERAAERAQLPNMSGCRGHICRVGRSTSGRMSERPPRRLAPDPEEVARKVLEELHEEGWTTIEIATQGWDDHPQVGQAWWISLEGVPPQGAVYGQYTARMFAPRLGNP